MASKWLDWEPGAKFQTGTTRGARVPEVPKAEAGGVSGTAESSSGTCGTCHLPPSTKKPELPWPAYNGGKQFRCDRCGSYFDTSAGFAKHQVYGCNAHEPTEATAKTLPRCAECGSYALYREKDGTLTCQTCERER